MINNKFVFFYSIGAIMLYLEPIKMAGFTFGILWKLLFMFIIFIPVLYKTIQSKHMELFAFIAIVYAFKTLISYSSMDYLLNTFTLFFKGLMFPILYIYFVNQFKKETLIFIAKHFAILIILSFIPYMLGILEPIGEGYKLEAYGLDGKFGLVGPFLYPHSASISISFAMIVLTSHIKKENQFLQNLFYVGLLLLGFYELMATYVRTGLAIYLLVLFYIYVQNINLKKVMVILLATGILGVGTLYLIQTNEIVKMRFEERNKYNNEGELGSGRITYWKTAVNSWLNDDSSVIFIGLGEEYAKDKMEKVVHMRIFAHNEFFQILQQEGLIGLFLLFATLFLTYNFILRHQDSPYYFTSKILFIGLFLEMMLQGGWYFNIILFLSIYLALLKIDYLEKLEKNHTQKVRHE